jgi:hypothetical protein
MRQKEGFTNVEKHEGGIITFTYENVQLKKERKILEAQLGRKSVLTFGWGNGYIGLPKYHPFAFKDRSEIPPIASQVWTYGGLTEVFGEEYYVFGFDTCHLWQNEENWPESRVVETIKSYVPIAVEAMEHIQN